MDKSLEEKCHTKAIYLIDKGYATLDVFELTDLLYKLEIDKLEKIKRSDRQVEYNDEIVRIEPMGKMETCDISVSGDNLFYCNDILTKNSFGLPATADLMIALISTEELENLNQIMIKQLKNRYNDVATWRRFVVGIDRAKMTLYDVEDSAQTLVDDGAVIDQTPSGQSFNDDSAFDNSKFKDFK